MLRRTIKGGASNLERRTTRQAGYAISLSRRWLVEKGFGWLKQTGALRQVKLRGLEKVDWLFVFSCAAHNLIRLPRLIALPPEMLLQQRASATAASLRDDSCGLYTPINTGQIHTSNRFRTERNQDPQQDAASG
jgi:hypothetical protein